MKINWQNTKEWLSQPHTILLGVFYIVAVIGIFHALAENHEYLKERDQQVQVPVTENPDLNPDPSNVSALPVKPEPEVNPITFPQALALLRDPSDEMTNLQRYRLGAGVVGKRITWEGYIEEVSPASVDLNMVFVWLKPALSSEEKAQARFTDVGTDLDFFATLKKNQWVTINCLVMDVEPYTQRYVLDCTDLNLAGVAEPTK